MADTSVNRGQYMGGSDSGAVFGVNTFRPRSWVVRQKALAMLGLYVDRDLSGNPHIQRGNEMEPLIHGWVKQNLDPSVNEDRMFEELSVGGDPDPDEYQVFLHNENLRIGGHPDGVGDDVLHEYKATTTRSLERVHRKGPFIKHLLQVHHYMMQTGRRKGQLHYWNYNSWRPLTFDVEWRPDIHEKLEAEYEAVWEEAERLAEKYEAGEEKILIDLPGETQLPKETMVSAVGGSGDLEEIERMALRYEEVKSEFYDLKDERKELKSKLLAEVNGREEIVTPRVAVSAQERNGRYGTYMVVKVSER